MNLDKSYEFFQPEKCKERIHIIGCGSVGATVAELLTRFGLTRFSLYDFDYVEEHNLANQIYRRKQVGKLKTHALAAIMAEINPDVTKETKLFDEGYTGQRLSGYVFLCADDIELRREIVLDNKTNLNIKAMFDFRTRLTDAQHYAADWKDRVQIDNLAESMNFTNEEAKAETPVSACNVSLSVAPTVRMICSCGVANFINFAKGEPLKNVVLVDAFAPSIDVF